MCRETYVYSSKRHFVPKKKMNSDTSFPIKTEIEKKGIQINFSIKNRTIHDLIQIERRIMQPIRIPTNIQPLQSAVTFK